MRPSLPGWAQFPCLIRRPPADTVPTIVGSDLVRRTEPAALSARLWILPSDEIWACPPAAGHLEAITILPDRRRSTPDRPGSCCRHCARDPRPTRARRTRAARTRRTDRARRSGPMPIACCERSAAWHMPRVQSRSPEPAVERRKLNWPIVARRWRGPLSAISAGCAAGAAPGRRWRGVPRT